MYGLYVPLKAPRSACASLLYAKGAFSLRGAPFETFGTSHLKRANTTARLPKCQKLLCSLPFTEQPRVQVWVKIKSLKSRHEEDNG